MNAATERRGPGRPPDANGEDTRLEIIRVARRLFAQHGYVGTSTRMIAQEVGVTPAALHHYYGRKRDLVMAVWTATIELQFQQMQEAVDASDTFLGKVHALIDQSYHGRRRDRYGPVFVAAMWQEALRNPEFSEILEDDRRAGKVVRGVVEFGVATGAVPREKAYEMRGAIAAAMHGTTLLTSNLPTKRIDAMIEGCKRLFDGTLVRM